MSNSIKLKFSGTIARVADYDFGQKTYDEQVAPYLVENEKIIIEFPDQIVTAASSFVQGFFKAFIDRYGYEFLGNQVEIVTKNESLMISIKKNLI